MSAQEILLLAGLVFAAAVLYSSVGHAGASGYLAAMALFGLAPAVMKPTALTLNILVAALGVLRLHRAGLLRWRALAPFAALSVPFAFLGGAIPLPGEGYRLLVGIVLLATGIRFVMVPREAAGGPAPAVATPWGAALAAGAAIGMLSGLTGTGGGIFLSALLLLAGWAGARDQAGITAPFILLNSLAGLGGNLASLRGLPAELPWFVLAALLGALVGTQLGIRWLSARALERTLGIVLLLAAGKFLLT